MYKLLGICDERTGFRFHEGQVSGREPLSGGLRLYFSCVRRQPVNEREALEELRSELELHPLPWLKPGRESWTIDLDSLAEQLPESKRSEKPNWLTGRVSLNPLFEMGGVTDAHRPHATLWRGFTCFDITEEVLKKAFMPIEIPQSIRTSLETFYADYPPHTSPTAFIMMRFGKTPAHRKITQAIQKALQPFGIHALRADHKEYNQDLLWNILTYVYGCKFGIAVFERIEGDDFNPNVSLEVGYMMAMSKPVCFLKDYTLRALPTDLLGRLYRSFDPQAPGASIPPELRKWCQDLGFIS